MSDSDPSEDEAPPHEPPPYDAVAVGRVAGRVQITDVQLVYAHFERSDDECTPSPTSATDVEPEVVFDVDWAIAPPTRVHFLARFGVRSDSEPNFHVLAVFRLSYESSEAFEPSAGDLDVFAHWNVVFNAWPYFREYVSSTINRAGLPRLVLPVMRVPRATGGQAVGGTEREELPTGDENAAGAVRRH